MAVHQCHTVTLQIQTRRELDIALDNAVNTLIEPARRLRHGIRVTRNGPTTFVASVTPDVPFGTIQETVAN